MLTAIFLTTSLGFAAEPECPAPLENIRDGIQEAIALYDQFEFDAFQDRFDRLATEIECADGPLSRADVFQVYQLQGLDALVAEGRERMVAALRAMIAVRPDYTLPEELAAPGSTMAEAYAAAKQTQVINGLTLQGAGTWYVDGVLGVTELPAARVVVIQHLPDSDGLMKTWILDGQSQPESLAGYLGGGGGELLVIPPATAGSGSGSTGHLSRTLALSGAASAAIAVAGFAVAGSAYQRFPDEADQAKAQSIESLNHGATIGGGVFALAGGGLLAGAVIRGEW
jgi:hypothetical protein